MAKDDINKKHINDVIEANLTIHNRLFNHKHFIDGEINYLINKTEKTDCKDIDQLLIQIKDKNETKLTQIKEIKQFVNSNKLEDYCRKAEGLLKKSNKILTFDGINEDKRKLQNDDYDKKYKLRENEIKLENQNKLNEIDLYYERKKIETARYYHELESKWDV